MHVQIINFKLKDMSDSDYRKACDDLAPAFASVPGLMAKVWLASPSTNTYGGVYLWESAEALQEFKQSDLAATIASAYKGIEKPSVEVVDILFQLRE